MPQRAALPAKLAPERGIQDRCHAIFQHRRANHAYAGECCLRLQVAGDLDQLRGVAGGVRSCCEHYIIGGVFGLITESRSCKPYQRVKPEQASRDLGENLPEPIPAGDVSLLMPNGPIAFFYRPVQCVLGKQDHGTQQAPSQRRGDLTRGKNVREFGLGGACDTSQTNQANQQASGSQHGSSGPQP